MTVVTLTTDFGTRDGFVGAMKGVIARLAPEVTIVDLAHDVPRHDRAHAAWVLATATREFPLGTVHVAVVDPGVGGARADVVVAAGGHLYVGPDNGVLAYVSEPLEGAWAITSTAYRFPDAAPTFHGRDVFAPTAAALARGLPPSGVGPATCLAGTLPWPARSDGEGGVVVHVDGYGNLVTNLAAGGAAGAVRLGEVAIAIARTYEDVAVDALVAYVGSAGTIEIAVREGSAAARLGVARGAAVVRA